jgi:hypothetical protein
MYVLYMYVLYMYVLHMYIAAYVRCCICTLLHMYVAAYVRAVYVRAVCSFKCQRGWKVYMECNFGNYRSKFATCIFFFVEKGPAADPTDAPQPSGLLCNPVMKMISFFFSFFRVMEHRWNEIDRGKRMYFGKKTFTIATLSIANPTWTDVGSNPGLRGERPTTNRLSHGSAFATCIVSGWCSVGVYLGFVTWTAFTCVVCTFVTVSYNFCC